MFIIKKIKLPAFLLFSIVLFVSSCNQKPQLYGTPNVDIATIQSQFLNWYRYDKIYIDLSKDYHALNSNSEEISKEEFLEELSTAKYLVVRMNSAENTTFYKLIEIPEDGNKEIGNQLAKKADRELRNLKLLNNPFPDFNLKSLKGNSYQLSQFKDQYLVLNFWYTTCGKCKKELPDIEALAQKYKYRDIAFLNISLNEEHTLNNYLDGKNYQVETLPMNKKYVLDSLSIRLFPTYLIIDPNKKVINVSNNSRQLEKRVKEIIDELN